MDAEKAKCGFRTQDSPRPSKALLTFQPCLCGEVWKVTRAKFSPGFPQNTEVPYILGSTYHPFLDLCFLVPDSSGAGSHEKLSKKKTKNSIEPQKTAQLALQVQPHSVFSFALKLMLC